MGYHLDEGIPQPLFEQWDGQKWTIVPSPRLNTGYNFLNSIQAVSDTDVWAAGYRQVGGRDVTFFEHWDGARWSVVSTPIVPAGGNVVRDIAADDSGGVWAGGYVYPDDLSPIETLTLQLQGT